MTKFETKNTDAAVSAEKPIEHDKLGMVSHARNFLRLLLNVETTSTVFAINGAWGTGKTTFIKMLEEEMRAKKTRQAEKNTKVNEPIIVHFNAWETDFIEDPLVAFIGEINEVLKEEGDIDNFGEKASHFLNDVMKMCINNTIKTGSQGIVDPNVVLHFFEKDKYKKEKEVISNFKDSLKKCIGEKKLYIFIDELDRCKPIYAIKLLERMKHIFEVEGVFFVMAIDKKQLSHSVRKIYGNDFDAEIYLKKFIDIQYNIPKSEDLSGFIDHLVKIYGFDEFFQKKENYERENLNNIFKLMARVKELSLRDIEQLFAKINIAFHATGKNKLLFTELLAFLIIAKETHYDKYKLLAAENVSVINDVIALFHNIFPEEIRFKKENWHACAYLETSIICYAREYDESSDAETIVAYLDRHETYFNASETNEQKYSEYVLQCYRDHDFRHQIKFELVKTLVSRIEMLEDFTFDS